MDVNFVDSLVFKNRIRTEFRFSAHPIHATCHSLRSAESIEVHQLLAVHILEVRAVIADIARYFLELVYMLI